MRGRSPQLPPCCSAFRVSRFAFLVSHDRPPLPRREALGPRADLGTHGPLRREDPSHRARPRALAPVPQQEGRVHLRSEEHTSELQSPCNLVCRLLLEKKKQIT